jgi:hypothetical protein
VSWVARPVAAVAGGIVDVLGFGKYLRKDGRFSFQVDYGIAILNYACERAWPDRTKPRPDWMHKSDFIPCDCNKCFFCINNLTTGIQHKKRKVTKTVFIQHDNSRTVQKGCTTKRVNLQRGCEYCKMCYRKLGASEDEEIKALNAKAKKKLCKDSRLGCPSCDEHICTKCWAEGYDMHIGKDIE